MFVVHQKIGEALTIVVPPSDKETVVEIYTKRHFQTASTRVTVDAPANVGIYRPSILKDRIARGQPLSGPNCQSKPERTSREKDSHPITQEVYHDPKATNRSPS